MRSRKLVLRKETLSELATDELESVAGGTYSDTCVTYTIVPTGCMCTGAYPSLNMNCNLTPAIADTFGLSRCICG